MFKVDDSLLPINYIEYLKPHAITREDCYEGDTRPQSLKGSLPDLPPGPDAKA